MHAAVPSDSYVLADVNVRVGVQGSVGIASDWTHRVPSESIDQMVSVYVGIRCIRS